MKIIASANRVIKVLLCVVVLAHLQQVVGRGVRMLMATKLLLLLFLLPQKAILLRPETYSCVIQNCSPSLGLLHVKIALPYTLLANDASWPNFLYRV